MFITVHHYVQFWWRNTDMPSCSVLMEEHRYALIKDSKKRSLIILPVEGYFGNIIITAIMIISRLFKNVNDVLNSAECRILGDWNIDDWST